MSLITNNSIGWACLQMSGGWRRILLVCGVLAVGLPLLMFGNAQLDAARAAHTLTGWYTMLGVVQAGLLTLGVPSRVHAAIKRDRIGKLYESHRLMPAASAHAVAGYIVGSNLFLLSCVATIFAIGAFVAVPAEQDVRGWVALHAAALGVSAMLCCVVAFTAQWLPKFNPALLAIIVGPTVGAASVSFLPPLRVMFAPYFGTGFSQLVRGEVRAIHVVAFLSQAAIGTVLFIGACRRYRRDDVPALGFGWGLALLSLWVGLTVMGILDARPGERGPFGRDQPDRIAYVVAVSLCMALAIGPVASAATASFRWRERKRIDAYFIDRRPVPLAAATAIVTLVLGALLLVVPQEVGRLTSIYNSVPATRMPLMLTGLQIVLFAVTIAVLAHGAVRLRLPTAGLTIPWLVLTWVIVPVLDGLTTATGGVAGEFPHAMSSASPPFCLGFIWSGQQQSAQAGLFAQAGLVVVLWVMWLFLKRSNRASAIEAKLAGVG